MTADTCPTCGGRARKTYASILIGGVNRGFNNSQPVKEERHVGYESLDAAQIAVLVEALAPLVGLLKVSWVHSKMPTGCSRSMRKAEIVLADLPAAAREQAEERERWRTVARRLKILDDQGKVGAWDPDEPGAGLSDEFADALHELFAALAGEKAE